MIEIEQRRRPDRGSDRPIHVEFLYWEECPSHERALKMLRDALRMEGTRAEIQICRVDTEDEARALHFPGSPTIRINGIDIEGEPALPVGLSCRAYRVDGKISPVPSVEQLREAIREAALDVRPDDSRLASMEARR